MAGLKSVRLRISGRVQGVWYRGWAVENANRLGLAGWVRNRADGTVEAVFQGEAVSVDLMLTLCHEGPPAAHVSGIVVEPAAPETLAGFSQRPTE